MATALVSDLHLGTVLDIDLARRDEVRERLVAAVEGADHVVVLGDLLELRQGPVARVLELAEPFLDALAGAVDGRRLTVVPGNHDYQLAERWIASGRLEGAELAAEAEWPVEPGDDLPGRIAARLPGADVRLAYPGFRPRPDVYVTHGHYLDVHLTVPRIETLAASAIARIMGRARGGGTVADYEAVLGPLYALLYGLGQGASSGSLRRSGGVSRRVWDRVNGTRGNRLAGLLLGRVTIPGAVAAMNRAGLGPFSAELSGAELRRAGLRAIRQVVEDLGVQADHVIFGHTHRAGPLPGDDLGEWRLPGGGQLWNSGCWLDEPALMRGAAGSSPYAPGYVIRIPDEGPPELENVLVPRDQSSAPISGST